MYGDYSNFLLRILGNRVHNRIFFPSYAPDTSRIVASNMTVTRASWPGFLRTWRWDRSRFLLLLLKLRRKKVIHITFYLIRLAWRYNVAVEWYDRFHVTSEAIFRRPKHGGVSGSVMLLASDQKSSIAFALGTAPNHGVGVWDLSKPVVTPLVCRLVCKGNLYSICAKMKCFDCCHK